MIFYEAPHKLLQTLGEARARFTESEPRGEFVLVVAGAPEEEKADDGEGALARALELAASGLSARDAVRQAAEEYSVSRSALYRAFQQARE